MVARYRQSGGVLLVVLGVIASMGMVIALLSSYALERSLLAETRGATSQNGVGSRLSGAIEASIAVLSAFEEVGDGLHDPSEGWGRPSEVLSGWPASLAEVEVEVFDESSRPGLSLLQETQLLDLLEESGFSKGKASELTDILFDWMDEDSEERYQGRENSSLGAGRDPWVPNRAPKSWGEVWAIPEWRAEAFGPQGELLPWAQRFSNSFSMDHDSPGNLNAVDEDTADWLHEAGLIPYPTWIDDRDGLDNEMGSDDDRVISEVPGGEDGELGGLFGADSQVLRVRASMRVGERFVWKEVWIARDSGEGDGDEGNDANSSGGEEEASSPWGSWELIDVRNGLSLVLDDGQEEG
tara:strand:- start:14769 stop:15827 length:1059 start_codon:yes stop_codon:yes gene_type:complete